MVIRWTNIQRRNRDTDKVLDESIRPLTLVLFSVHIMVRVYGCKNLQSLLDVPYEELEKSYTFFIRNRNIRNIDQSPKPKKHDEILCEFLNFEVLFCNFRMSLGCCLQKSSIAESGQNLRS